MSAIPQSRTIEASTRPPTSRTNQSSCMPRISDTVVFDAPCGKGLPFATACTHAEEHTARLLTTLMLVTVNKLSQQISSVATCRVRTGLEKFLNLT